MVFRACWLGATLAAAAGAAVSRERVEALFRPWQAERVVLSPDGRYIAYPRQKGNDLTVDVWDVEQNRRATTLLVAEARTVLHAKDRAPVELRFLEWATEGRLVFAPTEEVLPLGVQRPPPVLDEPPLPLERVVIAPVMAVDASGQNPRALVDADDFAVDVGSNLQPRLRMRVPEILGFAQGKRDELLVRVTSVPARVPSPAAMAAGDPGSPFFPAETFRVNVATGEFKSAGFTDDQGFSQLFFDRTGKARFAEETTATYARNYLYWPEGGRRWSKLHEARGADVLGRFRFGREGFWRERALPLGIGDEPNVLIYASNIGRDTFGVYGLNLKTLQRTDLAVEHPERDFAVPTLSGAAGELVFDKWRERVAGVRARGEPPLTVWVDLELAEVQREVNERFTRRSVTILEWDRRRDRFLLRVSGGAEPGRIFLYRRADRTALELLRQAPWLPNAELHPTRWLEFAGEGGGTLNAHVTLPKKPKISPPPLVICFAGGFPPRPHPEFDAEAQVLADMGFMVARLNQRGVLGYGTKRRDEARGAFDRVAAADARAAVEAIGREHAIDRKRVVVMGTGFAGYLAVRTAQLEPEAFRCVVAIEPPLNLAAWVEPPADFGAGPPTFEQEMERLYLEGGKAKLSAMSALAEPEKLGAAVFVLYRSHRADGVAQGVAQLRGQLKRRGVPHETLEIGDDFVLGLPTARTRAYRALEAFLNENLYNPNVKIGPTRVVR